MIYFLIEIIIDTYYDAIKILFHYYLLYDLSLFKKINKIVSKAVKKS